MFKLSRLLVAVAAAALLLTGCGKDSSSSSGAAAGGKKSLTIWWAQWAPSDGLQELCDDYEKETGVDANVHQVPWPDFQKEAFLEFGNSTTRFDIVVGDSQWVGIRSRRRARPCRPAGR